LVDIHSVPKFLVKSTLVLIGLRGQGDKEMGGWGDGGMGRILTFDL